ncbi:protein kinase [Roseisolibacter sp. H3M3-2]|uniref:protein kinase domain-containing protein n=1 Tax=Roseisolibacter sp. H3M3-2 TaxID=3031323 RepID=UPI0023DACF99|nr:protein kinase [Roseisolibacter sp. H3M3-2]MDF1501711.1 protein kinase [Roseisolibacter sp. H3M3-2]
MAKKLKVGDALRGYRVTKVFGPGAMAISYAAESADGRRVFLKQYKSPAPTVVWYGAFVDYQQELAARVRGGKAAGYAVRLVDAFEETWGGRTYFQAYEFVEHGGDLQQLFDEERAAHERDGRSPLLEPETWARHVTWAKVLMAAIAALHESRVVHADLKPPNVYLIRDPSIGAGYQLKLIDMDFSVLADRRAPWHGHQGYVGSDNYRSPEHMTRGGVPGTASDVFTCGLLLYELLAGVHPYWRDDQAEYAALVRAHAATPPVLAGVMPSPADNAAVSAALHRCLSPDPAARPTAAELRAVLSGRAAAGAAVGGPRVEPSTATPKESAPRSPQPGAPLVSDRVQLVGAGGRALPIGVRTELGKHLARQFGDDAEFWDPRQMVLERLADGRWQVAPLPGTTNETLLNGEALAAPRALRDGDVLAVGRQAKGIAKLPLTVRAL